MKNNKGITLIALIITIIVMLILVGVTINVALNGGLFEKAKTASEKTIREVSREEIISATVGAYDRSGNFIVGDVKLPDGVQWCSENAEEYNPQGTGVTPADNEENWVITKDNNKFYITTDGTVLDKKPITQDPEPTGDPVTEIDHDTAYNISFKDLSKFSHEKWESIFEGGNETEWMAFYPANLTVAEALSTNNYASIFWGESSDGYVICYRASGGYNRSETDRYSFIEPEGKWFYNGSEKNPVTMENVKIAAPSFMQSQGQTPLTDAQLMEILNIVEVTN